MRSDVVIIGGGIIGSAAAYFLIENDRSIDVTVIEPDPTYEKSSTPAGAGGVRRLMARPENIQMSQFSLDFYADFQEIMATEAFSADIQFRRQGYLFLTNAPGVNDLVRNHETQTHEGVPADLLDPDQLRERFPSVGTDDVALACHSPQGGWIDPHAALMGFRSKAVCVGVTYVRDRVVGFVTSALGATHVELASGSRIAGNIFLNTSGAWVGDIAEMTGVKLPVVPMCRVQHFWRCAYDIEPLPLIKDDSGAFLRPEGGGFVGGRPSWEIEPGFVWDVDRGYFADYFENTVWQTIANMVPTFEAVRLERTWPGHYAQNVFDGNMIIGPYSNGHENILTACGFSGHGIMYAPAVGRALSELVIHGSFQTIDLSRMSFDRVLKGSPYAEIGIK